MFKALITATLFALATPVIADEAKVCQQTQEAAIETLKPVAEPKVWPKEENKIIFSTLEHTGSPFPNPDAVDHFMTATNSTRTFVGGFDKDNCLVGGAIFPTEMFVKALGENI